MKIKLFEDATNPLRLQFTITIRNVPLLEKGPFNYELDLYYHVLFCHFYGFSLVMREVKVTST